MGFKQYSNETNCQKNILKIRVDQYFTKQSYNTSEKSVLYLSEKIRFIARSTG